MTLDQLLHESGPCLSSTLVHKLQEAGISAATARQRVSRLRGDHRFGRLSGLKLPKREAFVYRTEDMGTEQFISNLSNALQKTNSAYGRPLLALMARDGIVPCPQLASASGLPVRPTKGHIPYSTVEDKLVSLNLIRRMHSEDGSYFVLPHVDHLSERRLAVEEVETIVLSVFKTWLGKIGWASPHKISCRGNSMPRFGQFEWDFAGPCYLSALTSWTASGPDCGFVVGDILLGKQVTFSDIIPFIAKWSILSAQKRRNRFQPFFIADFFERDALDELRRRGCAISIPSTLFGEEVAQVLRSLTQTLQNAASAVAKEPGKVFDLIKRLSKIEGASTNLRGLYFEFLIAHLNQVKGYKIELRHSVQASDRFTDIDVQATNPRETVCCECKAPAPGNLVSLAEVQKWETHTVPTIKQAIKNSSSRTDNIRFEFYSATGFHDDARKYLEHLAKTHVKQPITFFDGNSVLAALRDWKQYSLVDAFKEQFGPFSLGQ